MGSDDDFLTVVRETRILLSIIARTSEHSLERRLNSIELPISALQLGVMRALMGQEKTISDLSRAFVLDPSTLVPVVDTLERKGLVARQRDPNDRRRVPLRITPEGKRLMMSVPLIDDDDPLFHGLRVMGEERTQALLEQLRELMKTLPNGEAILTHIESRVRHNPGDPPDAPNTPKHEGGPKCWAVYAQSVPRRPYRRRTGTD